MKMDKRGNVKEKRDMKNNQVYSGTGETDGRKRRKAGKRRLVGVLIGLVAILVLQTMPVFFPKPLFAKTLTDGAIAVNYTKGEEKGAREVFDLLRQRGDDIRRKLGADGTTVVTVHLYPTQWQLAIREAGFATLLVAPEWHIGDSHGGNIMMVSPDTPVRVHTHDSILAATLHEWVHAVMHELNPDIRYFWDNGLATWLAGQLPDEEVLAGMDIPSLADTHTDNGLYFGQMGGYAFSYDYIRFLNESFGWNPVAVYARGEGSYLEVFGMTEEDLYRLWVADLEARRAKRIP